MRTETDTVFLRAQVERFPVTTHFISGEKTEGPGLSISRKAGPEDISKARVSKCRPLKAL
jgi:hypothetical protein